MFPRTLEKRWIALVALALLAGLALAWSSLASGFGVKYTFYQTAACQQVVGSQIFNCPGYPAEDDAYFQTPYYTTQTVQCNCTGGGGSGPGEGDDDG